MEFVFLHYIFSVVVVTKWLKCENDNSLFTMCRVMNPLLSITNLEIEKKENVLHAKCLQQF